MIEFEKFTLDNGLTVIVHENRSTPLAVVNILYNVGARDEDPEKTGFAHLFEHLMFGGSVNIPHFDTPLELVGGENNAFTNNDVTNYYLTLPAENLETGFWLESDRMLSLAFTEKSLEVQRNVVIEEFRQRYLNQPYGDVWLLLRPLVYKVHPYQWATIGKKVEHIRDAEMQDVKDFFYKYYRPNNAIMTVAGNVKLEEVKRLAEKWFGNIPAGEVKGRVLPQEPEQTEKRTLEVEREVPFDMIYMAFHIGKRIDDDYYVGDLASDILSRGRSARFLNELIKKQRLFSDVNAYISGDIDPGLFMVSGKLMSGVDFEKAEAAIWEQLDKLKNEPISFEELQKVKNKAEATHVFSEMETLNTAFNLSYFEMLGDAAMTNTEMDKLQAVTAGQINEFAKRVFVENNCSVLYYKSKK